MDIVRSLTIAGGLLGALAVILLILVTVVGTVLLVQKGIIFDSLRSINKLCHIIMLFCMYRFTNLEIDHKKEINVSYSIMVFVSWKIITLRRSRFNIELNEEHNNTVHGPQNEV